ncbi:sensor histidine kinase [Sporomusa sp.]|uniref:sensor histidine kinase n=1 Tax=Sporomusa sp. TaxID=2078658 RepID=UPI002C5E565C|nr:PocR ligand-binding domain-containing protein [Sporomusa sp.]HWR42173.1 PocR ligand-binding domain-containing protein [Sporomusa sp.]
MHNYNRFALAEIVNTQILQEIQDKFSETTGIAAVVVDADGKPVTKPSKFTDFCSYVRSFPEGLARCMACDDRGGRKAMELQRPFVYHCHSGLTDFAAPIIVQNEYVGALLAGQVVLPLKDFNAKYEICRRLSHMGMNEKILSELFDAVEITPENRLKAAADLLHIMANYIVEMGVTNIVQKQLMEELKAKAELENLLRAAEMKALHSQINPHFLFNTLNTIARLSLLEGAEQTQEVVHALSDLLRTNLRDIAEMRTLEEEIKTIDDYLTIQKVRFGDRIQASIDVDSTLLKTSVPALSLQPLVENAIIHGLEPKRDGGTIRISGHTESDKVVIVVSDTGIGIAPERISTIFKAEKRPRKSHTTGLGVINVHKRIQHYFGDQFGLSIESKVGEGTDIFIHLPTYS